MSRSGIVNVRMVITEEKILSNIDKIQKMINPNSKKQIVELEEDSYFKDLVESIKTYLNLYKVTSDWSNDGSVKWNAQPSFNENNAPILDYTELKSGSVEYKFDITKSVKEWYESESNNYGLALVSSNESVVNRAQLYSAENTAADIYPQISICYRNNKGLESYWSYSSYSNDTGGVAHVDNYTGNLVYEWPILSSVS